MDNKKLSSWIDRLLVVFGVLLFLLIVRRIPVRLSGEEPVARAAAEREPEKESPALPDFNQEGPIPITLGQLAKVEPDQNGHPVFSPELLALDGQTVQIQGFMSPYDDLRDMVNFMLFPFPTGCNFCALPGVNQVVLVRQKPRRRAYPFKDEPVLITGTLSLWSEASDDPAHAEDFFLYVMDITELETVEMDPQEIERMHQERLLQ